MSKKRKQASGFRSRAPTEVDKRVGRNIREIRNERFLTLAELAERLGISHQQLQKYETGTNRISASMIVDLVEVLNVPIEELFRGIHSDGVPKNSPLEKARQACRVWIDRTNSTEKLRQMALVLKALSGKE
tara:strand:- start:710 stop:1102 length:393 start_codon:yes stop_codon:yes gene_type:complete